MQLLNEANKHYNGTLNEFHVVSLLTDAGLNGVLTYHQAQKQNDRSHFVEAMENKTNTMKVKIIGIWCCFLSCH